MSGLKLVLITGLLLSLVACGPGDSVDSPTGASAGSAKVITFVDTKESMPLVINTSLFTTKSAKVFLATGQNTYIGNERAIAAGKKVFQLYSCTQCHGPTAQGQIGPGLVGPSFKYPKDATNKGMFETIWGGTNGGMGGKGIGVMDPSNPEVGLTPDEVLKVIAWIRSMSNGMTGNE